MIKETISIKDIANLLNELLKKDPKGIKKLFNYRVKTTTEVANHPSVLVASSREYGPKSESKISNYSLGFLGILNGLFGTQEDGCGFLYYSYKEYKNGQQDILSFGVKDY